MPTNPPAPEPPKSTKAAQSVTRWAQRHSDVLFFILGAAFTVLLNLVR